jgi:hypothetical protein
MQNWATNKFSLPNVLGVVSPFIISSNRVSSFECFVFQYLFQYFVHICILSVYSYYSILETCNCRFWEYFVSKPFYHPITVIETFPLLLPHFFLLFNPPQFSYFKFAFVMIVTLLTEEAMYVGFLQRFTCLRMRVNEEVVCIQLHTAKYYAGEHVQCQSRCCSVTWVPARSL